jgi:hypothetical protein
VTTWYRGLLGLALVGILHLVAPPAAKADVVLDWNTIAIQAMQTAPPVPGPLQSRYLAIVHAAVFDASTASNDAIRPFTSPLTRLRAPRSGPPPWKPPTRP